MKIEHDQISSSEPFGMLDGKNVNLVTLKGGLNLATTVDAKGVDTVLGAASHRAILSYSIEQRFPRFQPMIMKSEGLKLSADKHSHFLTDDLRKSGHDIYSVQDGEEIEFFITKQNIKVASVNCFIKDSFLELQKPTLPKEYLSAMSGALSEKALSSGLKSVRIK